MRLLSVVDAAKKATDDDASDEDRTALADALEKSELPMLAERAPKTADDALAEVENVSRIASALERFSHPGSDEIESVDVNEAITTTVAVSGTSGNLPPRSSPTWPPISH